MKNTEFRVLADADLILEFFVNRDKYIKDVETFMNMISSSSNISVYITDKCLKRLYLQNDDEDIVKEAAQCINDIFEGYIIEITKQIREEARKIDIIDMDSAEEYVCLFKYNIDAIVTLNPRNFDGVIVPVYSIQDILVRGSLEHTVTLNIPTSLQKFTNDRESLPLSGSNVRELIEQLEISCPGIQARLLDDSGRPRRFLNIYVNDEDIRFLDGMDTPLRDGDRVSIVPAVAGG
jgi:sulfur-carrier protein